MNNNFTIYYTNSRALSIDTVKTELDYRIAKHETELARKIFVRQGQQPGRAHGNRLFAFG